MIAAAIETATVLISEVAPAQYQVPAKPKYPLMYPLEYSMPILEAHA